MNIKILMTSSTFFFFAFNFSNTKSFYISFPYKQHSDTDTVLDNSSMLTIFINVIFIDKDKCKGENYIFIYLESQKNQFFIVHCCRVMNKTRNSIKALFFPFNYKI